MGVKLLETSVGRGKDRGSRLTPDAKALLEHFRQFNMESREACDRLFEKIFLGVDPEMQPAVPTVAVIGRKGSGRTELIGKLVAEWENRGKKIGVLQQQEQDDDVQPPDGTPPVLEKAKAVITYGRNDWTS